MLRMSIHTGSGTLLHGGWSRQWIFRQSPALLGRSRLDTVQPDAAALERAVAALESR